MLLHPLQGLDYLFGGAVEGVIPHHQGIGMVCQVGEFRRNLDQRVPLQEQRDDVLFFNPGAAGKRRFKVVPSIGFLTLEQGKVEGSIVPL